MAVAHRVADGGPARGTRIACGLASRTVNVRLPFDDETFDAVFCIDSINLFSDRLAVLRECPPRAPPGPQE